VPTENASAANRDILVLEGRIYVLTEALHARLKVLEDEILRLTELASRATKQIDQESNWGLAQDLQREARQLRHEIRKLSELPAADVARVCSPAPQL